MDEWVERLAYWAGVFVIAVGLVGLIFAAARLVAHLVENALAGPPGC